MLLVAETYYSKWVYDGLTVDYHWWGKRKCNGAAELVIITHIFIFIVLVMLVIYRICDRFAEIPMQL